MSKTGQGVIKTISGIRPLSFEPNADQLALDVPGLKGVVLMQHQILAIMRLLYLFDAGRLMTDDGIEIISNTMMLSMALGTGKTFIAIALLLLRRNPQASPQQLHTPVSTGMRVTRMLTGQYVKLQCSVVVAAKHILQQWADILKQHTDLNVFMVHDSHRLREFITLLKSGDINNFDVILVKTDPVAGFGFNIPGESENQETRGMVEAVGGLMRDHIVQVCIYDDFDTSGITARTMMINAARALCISATSDHDEALERNVMREANWDPITVPKSAKSTTGETNGAAGVPKTGRVMKVAKKPLNAPTRDYPTYEIETNVLAKLDTMQPTILNVPHDPHVSGPFNVRISREAIRQSRELPKIMTWNYVHDCADGALIDLIGNLGADKDAMEMLYSEATGTAATAMGIEATSVADVLEKLLGKAHARYAELSIVLANYTTLVDSGVMTLLDAHPHGNYTAGQITTICKRLDKMRASEDLENYHLANDDMINDLSDDTMEKYETALKVLQSRYKKVITTNAPNEAVIVGFWSSDDLMTAINERIKETKHDLDEVGKALSNVKDNFRNGRCGVCNKPHTPERKFFINKCCSIIVCVECGLTANRFQKSYYYKTGKEELHGSCPGCLANIRPGPSSMIFIDDIDVLRVLDGAIVKNKSIITKVQKVPAQPRKPTSEEEFEEKLKTIQSKKCQTMLRIVTGRTVANAVREDRVYPMLSEGDDFKPMPEGYPRKTIIGARHEETVVKVKDSLTAFGIKFAAIIGTVKEIATSLRQFNDDPDLKVLIINAGRTPGGMNIDIATDIILMHRIIDTSILSQLVGRAQRMGKHRQYSLCVHTLLMSNEV